MTLDTTTGITGHGVPPARMWSRLPAGHTSRGPQRVARVLTGAAVAAFWMVATSWQPWRLVERAGFSADFYDEQARVFLRGGLAVDPAVAGIEGFVVDDRTYLYFGPLLSIARMPVALTGTWASGRLTLVSMLVALVVVCTWAYRLYGTALRATRGRAPHGADRWRVALLMGAVAGSPLLALAGWISVYHETELWACALAVVAAVSMIEFAGAPSIRTLLPAAAAVIATVLTRASVGIGAAVALVLVAALVMRAHPRVAAARSLAACAVGAAVAGVAVHMALNVAKFGSLLSLPAERQVLTLLDPGRAEWFAGNDGSFFSIRFLPTTLLQYLRPDTVRVERLVPGIRFGPLADDIGSYPVESITPAASLTATAPVLLIAALIGTVLVVRHRRWPWFAVTAGLAIGAVPSFTIGFIANRYLVDMLPSLIVPATMAIVLVRRPARIPPLLARILVVVAVGWGMWVNIALGSWIGGLKAPGFTEVRYRIDAAVFPAPSPGLVELGHLATVPRDGIVGIDPSCAGVYIAEQGRWVALERAEGRRTVSGAIDLTGPGTLVESTGWSLELHEPGAAARISVVVDGSVVADHAAGPLEWGSQIQVVADPVIPEFWVRTPERVLFLDPSIPEPGDDLAARGLSTSGVADTPLCDLLWPRR